MKLMPPADVTDFFKEFIEQASSIKIWTQIRQGEFDKEENEWQSNK